VSQLIRQERPEIVAVELCPYRYAILTGGKIPKTARLNPLELLMSLALGFVQQRFARNTETGVGREMMVAVEEARRIGARVMLIDRDIQETIKRLNRALSVVERLRMFLHLVAASIFSGRRVDFSRLTDEDVVRQLVSEFRRLSPSAHRVLVEERDRYMAERLIPLLLRGCRTVCVVGAGHLLGIERLLKEALMEQKRRVWWRETLEWWAV
jgi:pheromone shutdown protein TraB